MRTWQKNLLISIPGAFVFKDVLATILVLSNEPGISGRKAFYYSIALLPGSLLVSNGLAPLANIALGFLIALGLHIWWRSRKSAGDESDQHQPALPTPRN
jgi:hypothetical protein